MTEAGFTTDSIRHHEKTVISCILAGLRSNWRALLLLLLAALVTRFWQLGQADLWMDEIFLGKDARLGTNKYVSHVHNAHLGPVGIIIRNISDTPTGLRTWGALLGSLTIPLLFAFGTIVKDRRIGLVLGLLGLFNPYMISYAQDADYYAGMMFYATLQLVCLAMFFRGARYSSIIGICLLAFVSYYNHPFSIIISVGCLAACGIGSLILPEIRREMYSLKPTEWGQKPAMFVVAIGTLGVALASISFAGTVSGFLASNFVAGGNYTNIAFGLPFFQTLYAAWGVTFFQLDDAAKSMAWLPFVLMVVGLGILARDARRDRMALLLAIFCIVMPIASYAFIFNLNAKRGFYIRYLSYLLPLFLLPIAWLLAALSTWMERRTKSALAVAISILPLLILQAPHLVAYFRADKTNFISFTEAYKANYKAGDPVLITAGQDDSQGWYYLPPAKVPYRQPEAVNLKPADTYGNMLADVLPTLLWGQPRVWVINTWRQLGIHDVYDLWDRTLKLVFHGTAAQAMDQDARLFRYDHADRMLIPFSATRFGGAAGADQPREWMIAGAGKWDVETSRPITVVGTNDITARNVKTNLVRIESKGAGLVELEGSEAFSVVARPVYDDVQIISPRHQAVLPDHDKHRLEAVDGVDTLWRERDGPCEYLLYQPKGKPRHLVLRAFPREAQELWLGVAVDGNHCGFWRVAPGPEKMSRIVTDVFVPPGNHRISVTGTTPRNDYSPVLPWRTGGIEWNDGNAANPAPRIDTPGKSSPAAWKKFLPWGMPGKQPNPEYFINRATVKVVVDEKVLGPSGLPALRMDFPATDKSSGVIGTRPVAVTPGTYLIFSTFATSRGTTLKEVVPIHMFVDAKGDPLPTSRFTTQTATTSTHLFGYWRRYLEVFPVPEGAAGVCLGLEYFPREINFHENDGSVWFDPFVFPYEQKLPFKDTAPVQGLVWNE